MADTVEYPDYEERKFDDGDIVHFKNDTDFMLRFTVIDWTLEIDPYKEPMFYYSYKLYDQTLEIDRSLNVPQWELVQDTSETKSDLSWWESISE